MLLRRAQWPPGDALVRQHQLCLDICSSSTRRLGTSNGDRKAHQMVCFNLISDVPRHQFCTERACSCVNVQSCSQVQTGDSLVIALPHASDMLHSLSHSAVPMRMLSVTALLTSACISSSLNANHDLVSMRRIAAAVAVSAASFACCL